MFLNLKSFWVRPWFWMAVLLLVSLSIIFAVNNFPSLFYRAYLPSQYLIFHNLVEVISVIISLQIFLLAWVTHKQTRNFRNLFIGITFLGVAIMDTFHFFSFPGMPGLFTAASTHKGIYFWLAARLGAVGALLAASFLPDKKDEDGLFSPFFLLMAVLTVSALIVLVDILEGPYIPRFYIEGQGLTPLKIVLEYVVMALGLAAFLAYRRIYIKEQKGSLLYIMGGLLLTVVSEMCFTFYSSAFDTYNLLGHIYKFTAYGLFSYALFISQIRQPYNLLEKAHGSLAESEKGLQKAFHNWQRTFEAVSDGVWLLDAEGRIIQSNGKFERLIGLDKEAVVNRHCFECAHGSSDFIKSCPAARVKQTGRRETEEIEDIERGLWLEVTVDPIRDGSGEITRVIHIVRDITERRQADEAKRLFSSQLLMAEETERKRIAQELHDGLGQRLSAIKFKVENSLKEKDENLIPEKGRALDGVIPMLKEAVEEVRQICMDLRPSILDDLGIMATLTWFCREFKSTYPGIQLELDIRVEEKEIPEKLKIVIYRVVQEGLNNIAKHSEAKCARLRLGKNTGNLELLIEDDGRGFSLEEAYSREFSKRGIGLSSMRERIELSGGTFTIESVKGKGTQKRFFWPESLFADKSFFHGKGG